VSNVIAELNGYRVIAKPDCDVEDPLKDRAFGHMVCHHRNYGFGEKAQHIGLYHTWEDWLVGEVMGVSREEIENQTIEDLTDEEYGALSQEEIERMVDITFHELDRKYTNDLAALPLYLYDHSGITMYTTGSTDYHQHDAWDSGQVGWIYIWKADALKWGLNKETWRQEAEKMLRQEIAAYDKWLRGDYWWLSMEKQITEDGLSAWATVDSIGGVEGDYVKDAIVEYFGEQFRALAEEI
jgi:hypothetical protein